jgi:hypothetical protein
MQQRSQGFHFLFFLSSHYSLASNHLFQFCSESATGDVLHSDKSWLPALNAAFFRSLEEDMVLEVAPGLSGSLQVGLGRAGAIHGNTPSSVEALWLQSESLSCMQQLATSSSPGPFCLGLHWAISESNSPTSSFFVSLPSPAGGPLWRTTER